MIIRRTATALIGAALAMGLAAGPVGATHTEGILDCGTAGTFDVEAASTHPATFEAPGPWSGLFQLEETTRVFRAFTIVTERWTVVREATNRNPNSEVTCTLTSSGLNFDVPWTMVGMVTP